MKSVSVECLKGLLPNLVTGWLGTAAVAGGITLGGPVAAAFSVSAICAFLACSLKGKQSSIRNADHDRKVMKSLRAYAIEGRKDHAALVAQLGNLGYDVRLSKAELDQRLDALEALVQKPDADHDELITFFKDHKILFDSLSASIENNFDQIREFLCEAMGRQDLTLGELKEGNKQILTEIGKLNAGVEKANAGIKHLEDTGARVETGVSDLKQDMRELLRLQRRTDRERTAEIEARVRKELEAEYRQENEANPVPGAPDPKETADRVIAGLTDPQVVADSNDDPAEASRILLRRAQAGNQQALLNAEQAARIATQAGDNLTAVDAWRFIITHSPGDVNAWNELGHLHSILGDLDAAADCYRKLPELMPGDDLWVAISYGNLGLIQWTRGDLDQAEVMYRKVLEIDGKLGRLESMAIAYGNLGVIYQTRGDLNEAETMHRKSLEINEKLGRLEGMASQYGNLGLIYMTRGDLDLAETMHKKSLVIEEKLGHLEGIASEYGNLGLIYRTRGDLDKAEAMHQKSLAISKKLGRLVGMAVQYGNLGLIHQTRGDLNEAEAMHQKALVINEKLGRLEGLAITYGNLGATHQTRGDLDEAEAMHQKALAINEKLGRVKGMASQYGNLGLIYETRGDLDEAEKMYRKVLEIDEKLGRHESMANAYGNLGVVYRTRGDLDEAEAMLRKSLAINEKLGRLEGMASDYANLGGIYETRGDLDQAREFWTRSRDLFKQIGMPHRVEMVQGWLDGLDADRDV